MQNPRLLFVWVVVFLVVLGALVFGGLTIRRTEVSLIASEAQIRDTRGLLFAVFKDQLDEETAIRGYSAARASALLDPYTAARETMPASIGELETSLQSQDLRSDLAAIQDAKRVNDQWVQTVAVPVIEGRAADVVAQQLRGKGLVDKFRVDIGVVDHDLSAQYGLLGERSQEEVNNLTGYVLIAGGLLLAAALVFTFFQVTGQQRLERVHRQVDDARVREELVHAAYQTERRIAQSLQEAIKQRELPRVPSIALSATYVPAQEEALVGGDWYDAFEIGGGRVFFTIGDIAGHGIDAAVAMSRVRSNVLSAALRDVDPARVLATINAEQCRSADWPLVTAIVGVADPQLYEFSYASAGHPPPVLVESDGRPRLLALGSPPLGASSTTVYETQRIRSSEGSMLVLYTDGVVEQTRNIIEGEKTLLEAVEKLSKDRTVDPAREIYRAMFDTRAGTDDIAILTIAFPVGLVNAAAIIGARGASDDSGSRDPGTGAHALVEQLT